MTIIKIQGEETVGFLFPLDYFFGSFAAFGRKQLLLLHVPCPVFFNWAYKPFNLIVQLSKIKISQMKTDIFLQRATLGLHSSSYHAKLPTD